MNDAAQSGNIRQRAARFHHHDVAGAGTQHLDQRAFTDPGPPPLPCGHQRRRWPQQCLPANPAGHPTRPSRSLPVCPPSGRPHTAGHVTRRAPDQARSEFSIRKAAPLDVEKCLVPGRTNAATHHRRICGASQYGRNPVTMLNKTMRRRKTLRLSDECANLAPEPFTRNTCRHTWPDSEGAFRSPAP